MLKGTCGIQVFANVSVISGANQYLDHKNCVCKNKLIGSLIEECTSVINETMINNRDSGNNNTLRNVFIGLFSVAVLIGIICFCVFANFKRFKGKNKYADY